MASTTSTGGVRIDYDTDGGDDPSMIFVHGWSCDRSFFAPQVAHFAKRHRVASVDLRGHGTSDQPDVAYAIDDFAADVAAVAAAEGMDRPVVVGHSMGGLIALAIAASGGARAAVMVDPAPIVGPLVAMIGGLADRFAGDADGAMRAQFAGGMFLPSDDADRRGRIVASMAARPVHIAAAAITGIGAFDGPAALAACAVPLLSIGSATPTNAEHDLKAHCKHVAIGQTVGSGHFNQLEVPDQVNAMIEKFLEISL